MVLFLLFLFSFVFWVGRDNYPSTNTVVFLSSVEQRQTRYDGHAVQNGPWGGDERVVG